MDGWNGHICRNPAGNHHCVGPHSYPGHEIRDKRNLDWGARVAGRRCSTLDTVPPCIKHFRIIGSRFVADSLGERFVGAKGDALSDHAILLIELGRVAPDSTTSDGRMV
jgi:hypothetical protein